jgi:hypothetical protein
MMVYSPLLDSAVALLALVALIYGSIAFVVVIFVEILILWRLGWGSFLYSLLTSFIMNLASTFVGGWLIASFYEHILETYDSGGKYFMLFLLLFLISLVLEGGVMLAMDRSRHKKEKVWGIALIANVISYILLGIGFSIVW